MAMMSHRPPAQPHNPPPMHPKTLYASFSIDYMIRSKDKTLVAHELYTHGKSNLYKSTLVQGKWATLSVGWVCTGGTTAHKYTYTDALELISDMESCSSCCTRSELSSSAVTKSWASSEYNGCKRCRVASACQSYLYKSYI